MKRRYLVVVPTVLLGLGLLYAMQLKNDNSFPNAKAVTMHDSLKLSDEELVNKQKEALDGSPEAGYELVEYYSVYVGDDMQVMYWAQIAAENGDAKDAQNAFNYANFLSFKKDDISSLIRARFWARRATEAGTPLAKSLLSKIDSQIKSVDSGRAKK